ncbi:hypothetical protein OC834_004069 [Tilletia horrida]|nr:hypothetical protein OC834_004069 [Tilletia horrida]
MSQPEQHEPEADSVPPAPVASTTDAGSAPAIVEPESHATPAVATESLTAVSRQGPMSVGRVPSEPANGDGDGDGDAAGQSQENEEKDGAEDGAVPAAPAAEQEPVSEEPVGQADDVPQTQPTKTQPDASGRGDDVDEGVSESPLQASAKEEARPVLADPAAQPPASTDLAAPPSEAVAAPAPASLAAPVSSESDAKTTTDSEVEALEKSLGASPVTAVQAAGDPLGAQTSSSTDTPLAPPDSPAPSVPSKPNTPRFDRLSAPLRQGSLPPPPPPEKSSADEIAKVAHAFGRELSPAATPSPRRSTDKALPPTADDLASAVAASSSSSGTAAHGLTDSGPTSSSTSPRPMQSGSSAGGIRVGKGPPPATNPSEELPFDFNRFLEQMRHRSAVPVGEYVRSFIRGFSKKPYRTADQIRLIFDFLAFITEKMREAEVWANSTPAEFDNATEAMEKLIMNRLYSLTFTPAVAREGKWAVQTDDLERDRIIKDRILLFSWIRPEHLDIPVGEHTAGFVEFAAQELLKMNNYKAPRDKLICILNCCKVIFGMIRHMATSESADSFVPALIYVVLKANPDNLVSNVEYISRFRSPDRLSSESGYYLSSLRPNFLQAGAISFVETMDHTSLTNVTQEEMERNVDAAVTALALAAPPSPPTTRSGVSLSGSNSPFAEEGARTLQSLAPIAASLADDTRMFLQRTGEAARAGLAGGLGRPMGALGKLFNEGLDGIRTPSPAGGGSSSSTHAEPRPGPQR